MIHNRKMLASLQTIEEVVSFVKTVESEGKGADFLLEHLAVYANDLDDTVISRFSAMHKLHGCRHDEWGYAINSVWAAIVHRHSESPFITVAQPSIKDWIYSYWTSVRRRVNRILLSLSIIHET